MPEFYVEGHTAEGAPYGPVHILTTPLEECEWKRWVREYREAEQAGEEESARQGAGRESEQPKGANAVMQSKYKGEDIG